MTDAPATHRLRRPGRSARLYAAVAVALVVTAAGVGLAEYISEVYGEPTLVIYTYPSLLGGVDCGPAPGSPVYDAVFGAFATAHHIRIELACPAGTLVGTLEAEKNAPGADLVLGLDEITTPEAEARGLLVPYAPPGLADEPAGLAAEISPDDAAVPYEYGYLAIDYSQNLYNSTHGAIARANLSEFATNASTWGAQLVTEDPTQDLTGQEFLAWEVEYYETVLHENWTAFWTAIAPDLPPPAPSWGFAFDDEFRSSATGDQAVVSYSTDAAYAKYAGTPDYPYNVTVSWSNGTAYGWKTIYGIGIVSGTRHLALAEAFENWFLSGTVQAELPTTEWEYPANTTVGVPAVFEAAIPPGSVVALNDRISPATLAADIPVWSEEWESILASA